MSKKGLTLVELLVIIAIIIVLAAILFPVLLKAKETSKRITCTSQMKQLGMAMRMYINDNQKFPGLLPNWDTDYDEPNTSDYWWMGKLYNRYVKNYKIFKCPKDPAPVASSTKELIYRTSYAWRDYVRKDYLSASNDFSYFVPGGNERYWDNNIDLAYLKCSICANTAASGKDNSNYQTFTWTNISGLMAGPNNTPICNDPKAIWPHSGGTNYLYLDGHVKWYSKAEAIRLYKDGKQSTSTLVF